jgi:hypothetical protein
MNDQQIVEALDRMKPLSLEEKSVLMRQYLNDERFCSAVRLATDSAITFGVSNVKKVEADTGCTDDIIDHLEQLSNKAKGNATKSQRDQLNKVASVNEYTFDLARRIVRKTLDCGIGEKRLYEIAPRIIPYYPYMRCSGIDKLDRVLESGEAYSQLKDNGLYLDVLVDVERWLIRYRTRNGNLLKIKLPCEKGILVHAVCSGTFMGEATLLFPDRDQTMPRAAGNAIVTQSIYEPMPENIAERIRINLWDFVPADDYRAMICCTPYEERVAMVDEFICEAPDIVQRHFDLIETRLVKNEQEVWEHFRSVKSRPVADGCEELEGLVVKNPKAIWKDGTSSDQAKVKDVKECEMVITGWTPGDPGSKYEGMIGSLRLESSCKSVVVNSSGMKDDLRKTDPESLIGKIWGVKFTRVSSKKGSDVASLENPRLTGPRPDKTTADDREYIENLRSIDRETIK